MTTIALVVALGFTLCAVYRKYERTLRWVIPMTIAAVIVGAVVLSYVLQLGRSVFSWQGLTYSLLGLGDAPYGGWIVRLVTWALILEAAVAAVMWARFRRGERPGWLAAHWELACLAGTALMAGSRWGWMALQGVLPVKYTTPDGGPIPMHDADYAQFFPEQYGPAQVIEADFGQPVDQRPAAS